MKLKVKLSLQLKLFRCRVRANTSSFGRTLQRVGKYGHKLSWFAFDFIQLWFEPDICLNF